MRAYFPLPPTITIAGIQEKINGSLTFLNCPNNRLKPNFSKNEYKESVFLGLYLHSKNNWNLLDVEECKPMDFLDIKRNKFNVEDNQMVVAILKKINNFKKVTKTLLEPDSLRIDNSYVEQRVSLNFSFMKSVTSYQGDYPLNMSKIKKGSLFTFDALKENKNSSTKNFLILMNISKNCSIKEPENIKIFNPSNKDEFLFLKAFRNSFNIFETQIYEKLLGSEETIFLTSDSCSFIPIMLSIDLKTNQLSVEHTHPPSEYFFGPQKIEFMNILKKIWTL